jgi:hypothetical protein
MAALTLVVAATVADAADDKPLSFAFASQAGSGIYDIEGRVVQIYRIPISFGVKALGAEERDWGISVSSPLTFGFYDFKPEDVFTGEFPTHVGTASLLPGVAFPVRAKTNWILTPHVDFGAAKEFSGGDLAWVYDLGLRSDVSFPSGSWDALATQEAPLGRRRTNGKRSHRLVRASRRGIRIPASAAVVVRRSQWDVGLSSSTAGTSRTTGPESVTYAAVAPDPDATPDSWVDEQTEIGFSFGTRPKLSVGSCPCRTLG